MVPDAEPKVQAVYEVPGPYVENGRVGSYFWEGNVLKESTLSYVGYDGCSWTAMMKKLLQRTDVAPPVGASLVEIGFPESRGKVRLVGRGWKYIDPPKARSEPAAAKAPALTDAQFNVLFSSTRTDGSQVEPIIHIDTKSRPKYIPPHMRSKSFGA